MFLRSHAQPESSLLLLDSLHLGSALLLRTMAHPGLPLSVLDFLSLGFLLLARSFTHLDLALLVSDFLHLGSSLSSQSFACLGPVVLLLEVVNLGAFCCFSGATTAWLLSRWFLELAGLARPHPYWTTSMWSCCHWCVVLFILDSACQ